MELTRQKWSDTNTVVRLFNLIFGGKFWLFANCIANKINIFAISGSELFEMNTLIAQFKKHCWVYFFHFCLETRSAIESTCYDTNSSLNWLFYVDKKEHQVLIYLVENCRKK